MPAKAPVVDKFCVVDVETANPTYGSICSIAILTYESGELIDTYYKMVNPECLFEPRFIKIHGIRPQDVSSAEKWPDVYREIVPLLQGEVIVSHTAFDCEQIQAACDRYALEVFTWEKWIDSCRTARKIWPEWENHKLVTCARMLGVVYDAHKADEDCRATAIVMIEASKLTGKPVCKLDRIPSKRVPQIVQVPISVPIPVLTPIQSVPVMCTLPERSGATTIVWSFLTVIGIIAIIIWLCQ